MVTELAPSQQSMTQANGAKIGLMDNISAAILECWVARRVVEARRTKLTGYLAVAGSEMVVPEQRHLVL